MRASEIMTRPVITVSADTTVRQAAAMLTQHGITAMPVLGEDGGLIGMVSESDLLRGRMPHDPRSHLRIDLPTDSSPPATVGEAMTTPAVSMSQDADAADLAELMVHYEVRSVPIVDGTTVIGIVSRRDLLRTLVRDDELIEAQVRDRLTEYTRDASDWTVRSAQGVVTVEGQFTDDAARRVTAILASTVPGVLGTHVVERHTSHPTSR